MPSIVTLAPSFITQFACSCDSSLLAEFVTAEPSGITLRAGWSSADDPPEDLKVILCVFVCALSGEIMRCWVLFCGRRASRGAVIRPLPRVVSDLGFMAYCGAFRVWK